MTRVVVATILLMAAGLAVGADSVAVEPALLEMVNAEKEFAAYTGKVGVRDGFLKYFAEDSILFVPAPAPAVEDLRKQPPAPQPLPALLEWEPLTGEVSADGEFGYLTGPTRTSDRTGQNRPTRHGMYFSVWRKAGGEWKVIVDGGITTPGPVAEIGKMEFRRNTAQARTAAKKSGGTVENAEQALAAALAADGAEGYLRFAAANARLYRSGSYPMAGSGEVRAHFAKNLDVQAPKMQGSGMSKTGDLGYTYGTYGGTGSYFMRMWKRQGGDWKILFDIKYDPRPEPAPQAQN